MYNHLTLQMYDPTLAQQATMWGHADIPTIHNRGAVADSDNLHSVRPYRSVMCQMAKKRRRR